MKAERMLKDGVQKWKPCPIETLVDKLMDNDKLAKVDAEDQIREMAATKQIHETCFAKYRVTA